MVKLAQWALLASVGVAATSGAPDGESILTAEVGRMNNQSLFWGPYKPNLYFGIRPRATDGLWTGLSWSQLNNYGDLQTSEFWPRLRPRDEQKKRTLING